MPLKVGRFSEDEGETEHEEDLGCGLAVPGRFVV